MTSNIWTRGPRQENVDPSIVSIDNISADKAADRSSKRREFEENRNEADNRQELIAKASKSAAEEKEEEKIIGYRSNCKLEHIVNSFSFHLYILSLYGYRRGRTQK
jgi:hypothetical protein